MRKYFAIFRVTLINNLAYPGELIGRSLMILPFMWIFYQLWRVTFAASGASGTDTINGLTVPMTIWYLLLAETIDLSRPRLGNTISEAVKDGSIAYILSKPYDFLLYHYSVAMGETIFWSAINALMGGALVWFLVGPPPDAWGWPLVALTVFGAWTLNFYPAWLQAIAKALPFSSMLYGPARLFVEPSLPASAAAFGMQLGWIAALSLLLVVFYRRSLAHLTVNGG